MDISSLNIDTFRIINDLGKEYMNLNSSFVFIAEYTVYFLALSVLLFWFTRDYKNRIMIVSASVTFIISEIIGKIAGKFHSNYQPFAELPNVNQLIEKAVDNSFPSDHTILFFSFCITFWLFNKRGGFLWFLLAVIVGISRIWVGVHYPADVAVGAIISITIAIIIKVTVPKSALIKKGIDLFEKVESHILPAKAKARDF